MPRRSVLFSPGDQPDKLRTAAASGADVVVFDLEDAVAPSRKADARATTRRVLADPSFDPDAEVSVRVNPGDAAREDLDALLGGGDGDAEPTAASSEDVRLDAVVLPKTTGAADVDRLAAILEERGRDLPVIPLIESAAGVLAAASIAAAEATTAVVFGAEDLAADIGAERTAEGTEVLYAREHVVLAASAADVDAVDTLYTDFGDDEGLHEDARLAARLGYDGKLAIHPRQVPVIHDAFAPDPDRITWARRVLDARDAHEGDGVFQVDGEMIDAPLVAQAERLLDRAGEDPET